MTHIGDGLEGIGQGRGWPKVIKSHTYSSENADVYRAYDNGQKDMLKRCKVAVVGLGRMLTVWEILEIMNKKLVHSNDCTGWKSPSTKCNCGLEQTAVAIHEAQKKGKK